MWWSGHKRDQTLFFHELAQWYSRVQLRIRASRRRGVLPQDDTVELLAGVGDTSNACYANFVSDSRLNGTSVQGLVSMVLVTTKIHALSTMVEGGRVIFRDVL